jgi:glucose-1-phosphate adenylyltransferase
MNARESNELPRTQALILAGGQGERLFPLTRLRAKAAVPFGGAFRIIDFTLSNCLKSGLTDVALLTQHLHEDLQSYIWQGWSEFWIRSGERQPLVCLPPVSGKRYRGTADAVFQNIPVISPKEPQHVLILSGDHVYRMDYRELLRKHVEADADLTISVIDYPLEDATELGVVEVDEDLKVTGFSEKPSQPRSLPQRPGTALVNMGIYIFKMQTLVEALHKNCSHGFGYDFGHHIIPSLIGCARIYAYNFREEASKAPCYWRDIGTIDSYYAASMDLLRPDPPFDLNGNKDCEVIYRPGPTGNTSPLTKLAAGLSADARLSQLVISDGVRIEGDAEVESSILLPGARVAKGVRLRRVIVGENVQIPEGLTVGWNLESDRKRHKVTPSGIVVISETPHLMKPPPFRFNREGTAVAHARQRATKAA